jgi:hypothetical protein
VTHLRQLMLDELQRRNYSGSTAGGYLSAVGAFAQYFGKPPDQTISAAIKRTCSRSGSLE